jgi:hypothetical protein
VTSEGRKDMEAKKRICIMVRSQGSAEPVETVCRTYDQGAPEVIVLGEEGSSVSSASGITVTYDGGGLFSVRSKRGSRITLRGKSVCELPVPE